MWENVPLTKSLLFWSMRTKPKPALFRCFACLFCDFVCVILEWESSTEYFPMGRIYIRVDVTNYAIKYNVSLKLKGKKKIKKFFKKNNPLI